MPRYNIYINHRFFAWDHDEAIVMKFAIDYREAFPDKVVEVFFNGKRVF